APIGRIFSQNVLTRLILQQIWRDAYVSSLVGFLERVRTGTTARVLGNYFLQRERQMANITGTGSNDFLDGPDTENNTINGLGGRDNIFGGNLKDEVDRGDGNDTISGGLGNDILTG